MANCTEIIANFCQLLIPITIANFLPINANFGNAILKIQGGDWQNHFPRPLYCYKAKNDGRTAREIQQFYVEHLNSRLEHLEKLLGI